MLIVSDLLPLPCSGRYMLDVVQGLPLPESMDGADAVRAMVDGKVVWPADAATGAFIADRLDRIGNRTRAAMIRRVMGVQAPAEPEMVIEVVSDEVGAAPAKTEGEGDPNPTESEQTQSDPATTDTIPVVPPAGAGGDAPTEAGAATASTADQGEPVAAEETSAVTLEAEAATGETSAERDPTEVKAAALAARARIDAAGDNMGHLVSLAELCGAKVDKLKSSDAVRRALSAAVARRIALGKPAFDE